MHHGVVNGSGIVKEFSDNAVEKMNLFWSEGWETDCVSILYYSTINRCIIWWCSNLLFGAVMIEFDEHIFYISWHGKTDGSVAMNGVVIPFKCNSNIRCTRPISCDGITELKTSHEMDNIISKQRVKKLYHEWHVCRGAEWKHRVCSQMWQGRIVIQCLPIFQPPLTCIWLCRFHSTANYIQLPCTPLLTRGDANVYSDVIRDLCSCTC